MKKEKLYKGKLFEINAYHMQVEHRKVRREVIEHPGAAAMLAFDEKGKVLLVKQHRFPHGYILEIPAGTLEKGEKPIDWDGIIHIGIRSGKLSSVLIKIFSAKKVSVIKGKCGPCCSHAPKGQTNVDPFSEAALEASGQVKCSNRRV